MCGPRDWRLRPGETTRFLACSEVPHVASVRIEHVDDVALVVTEGRFVGNKEIEALDQALKELVLEAGAEKVLVDLSETPLMSSMALGVLIKTQRASAERGVFFVLCGAHVRLRSVIERCFGSLLEMFDRRDEAIESLRKR